jgi:transposase
MIRICKKGKNKLQNGSSLVESCLVKRAWYKSANGQLIDADINASLNITTKVVPAAFSFGIEGIAVCPSRITPGKVT